MSFREDDLKTRAQYPTLEQRARDACWRGEHTRSYADDNVCACAARGIAAYPDLPSATQLSRAGGSPAMPTASWHPPSFEI